MKIYDNGIYRELTTEELKKIEIENKQTEVNYWKNVEYSEAVNNEIRKKYSMSQEFAILRQKDEKSNEYNTYYAYCEECKRKVKTLFDQYGVEYES